MMATQAANAGNRSKKVKLFKLNSHNLDGCGDVIGSIYDGQIDGVAIEDFMSSQIVRSCTQSLIDNPSLMRSSSCPYGRIYARTILGMGNQSEQYFEDARVFRTECERLFGEHNFETHLTQLLSKIAGSRTVSLPLDPSGTPYSPATIRWIEPKGAIAPHCEKVYFNLGTSAFKLLDRIAAAENILSFFMLMAKPEIGGELILYDLDFSKQNGNEAGKKNAPKYLDRYCNPTPIPISVGELIIFNAGDIWHQISQVEGTIGRITIGGFLSLSKDRQTLYYFS